MCAVDCESQCKYNTPTRGCQEFSTTFFCSSGYSADCVADKILNTHGKQPTRLLHRYTCYTVTGGGARVTHVTM